ncbi:hypothetical protein [Maribacter sp. 2210JD10-5]|uniref:hypothetical protein n=1 Tax=Maribacter sp. 2210JD10-5 TaxID=3386272 RepID=UPI0039BD651E
MGRFFILLSCILFNFNVSGQTSQENLVGTYSDYFELPRESGYLHTNKTTYITGENIWLKSYVFNRKTSKPFVKTTNLHIALHNEEGNVIKRALILSKNGYGQGNIQVDSSLASGNYFLSATTNWMRNFKEDDSFVRPITIVNKVRKTPIFQNDEYELMVFPEGGNLVADVESTVGVKLTDSNGYGVPFINGEVLNEDGLKIMDFKSNRFGIGSFPITPELSEYSIRTTLVDGTTIKAKLPAIHRNGVVLKVLNNYEDSKIKISAAVHNVFADGMEKYSILVHKNGTSKLIPLVKDENDAIKILEIEKNELLPGINIITLFNESYEPLAERMVFNEMQGKKDPEINIGVLERSNDSILISLNIENDYGIKQNLSVSVLPNVSLANKSPLNIKSEFYLKPFIRGFIESPSYYFENVDRQKHYDLDLLLLTQGWSRYEWRNIFNGAPEKKFEIENGLKLIGRINEEKMEKYNSVFIEASDYHDSRVITLEDTNFTVDGFFIDTNDSVEVKLLDKKGKAKAPYLFTALRSDFSLSKLSEEYLRYRFEDHDVPDLNFDLKDKIIVLDEVQVSDERLDNVSSVIRDGPININLEIAQMYPLVTDLIRRRSFNVIQSMGDLRIINRRSVSLNGGSTPLIFLDGTRMPLNGQALDFLSTLRTAEIEQIEINPYPDVMQGIRGANGTIRIWTRKDFLLGDGYVPFVKRAFVQNNYAFTAPKEYYSPKYDYGFELFSYLGAIHWEPELVLEGDSSVKFKIPDSGLNNIDFYIEGMGNDGSLISEIKTINLTKNSLN